MSQLGGGEGPGAGGGAEDGLGDKEDAGGEEAHRRQEPRRPPHRLDASRRCRERGGRRRGRICEWVVGELCSGGDGGRKELVLGRWRRRVDSGGRKCTEIIVFYSLRDTVLSIFI